MNNITKLVIPAAGLGTRFLPITKTFAKEMLPIIDKPNLQFLLEEAKASGIKEVILIINDDKPEITAYFSHSEKLEAILLEKNKVVEYQQVFDAAELIKIKIAYQHEQLGLGHAILCAAQEIGDDDFALMLGDELVISKEPAIGQLIKCYEKYNSSIIGVQKVPHEKTVNYGIIDFKEKLDERTYDITNIVEKPKLNDAPTNYACLGRYVIKNSVMKYLANIKRGAGNEYQLTDALAKMLESEKMYAYEFVGDRYDIGSKCGYVKAIIDQALSREDMHDEIMEFLQTKTK
ncbi:MAG: UTP--glucose-1-phosphate uridylyltransferase [Bacilli bacterium]